MAKREDKSAAIQRLIEERRKIEQWLERLANASDKAAGPVRDKVRSDYERRLGDVTGELQGYESDLRTNLDRHQATRARLEQQEGEANDELAEAELRHTVGEFDESDWRDRKAGILERLVQIREELADEQREITELESIFEVLNAPAPQADEAAVEEIDEIPAPDEAEGRGNVPRDELAFLKSVTDDEEQGPRASRASGSMRAPDLSDDGGSKKKKKAPAEAGAGTKSGTTQRTLKCSECGAMNLPTEWYCERCGAELAAL
ncbi:MAG TPA: hypothetical protein VJ992_05240 [Gemmatimonadales bacterium]|nr:hypothetical protein [Gemmatimonadales bacterium]